MPRIHVQFDTLKQTRWHECLIRFALGGAITVIAGLLGKKFGPAVGGLFLAFPAIFPSSATLVEKHEQQRKQRKGHRGQDRGKDAAALDALGASLGSIGLALFALFVWQVLPHESPALILIAAAVLWFVASGCCWLVREYRRRIFHVAARHTERAGQH